ncbi:MAG: hypothetical protein WCI50_10330 [Actinomycetes bacterium]
MTDGRRAATALGIDLHRFPSGHEPYAETPDAWAALVASFLESVPTTGARWATPSRP